MTTETITLITAILGAACGVTGTILGIMNMWHQILKNKVKLKIIPQHVITFGVLEGALWNFSIDVINLSDFPVTIADVGFLMVDGRHGSLSTIQGLEYYGALPLRLEPRAGYSKTFRATPDTIEWGKVRSAYARTQCGAFITGTSGALKQLITKGPRHVE